MTKFYSTREAADRMKIPVQRLQTAVWRGSIPRPEKSPSGDFLWREIDILKAMRAMNLTPIDIEGQHHAIA